MSQDPDRTWKAGQQLPDNADNDQRSTPLGPSYDAQSQDSSHEQPTVPFTHGQDFSTQPYVAPAASQGNPGDIFQGSVPPGAGPYYQSAEQPGFVPQGAGPQYMPQGDPMYVQPGGPVNTVPPKRKRNNNVLIAGVLVLVLVVGCIVGILVGPTVMTQISPQNAAVASPTVARATSAAGLGNGALASSRAAICTQVAQGLHMTTQQLVAQLNAGKTLSSIASAQGISSGQLKTIVTNTFQQGLQSAVTNQNLTSAQENALIKRMLKQPRVLDRYLGTSVSNNAGGAPSRATATATSGV